MDFMKHMQGVNNMNKKIIMLVMLIFVLCGCSANVNVDITGNSINESVIINAYQDNSYSKDQIKKAFREYVPAFAQNVIVDTEPDVLVKGIKYYNRVLEEMGNGYRVKYDYKFRINDYKDARTIKDGFRSSTIQVDKVEETILISTDNGGLLYFNKYPSLDNVSVNVTTSYKVIESNANSVNGNVYTWYFNKNGKNGIYLLLDTKTVETEEEEKKIKRKATKKKKQWYIIVRLKNS